MRAAKNDQNGKIDHPKRDDTELRKMSSDGAYYQQHDEERAAKRTKTTDVQKKLANQAEKTLQKTSENPTAESKPTVLLEVGDCLKEKLSPGYTELSMAVKDIRQSCVVKYCGSAWFSDLETDEKYKHGILFPLSFLFRDLHRTYSLLSKTSVLFLPDVTQIYGTVGVVDERDFITNLWTVWSKAVRRKDGLLALSFFSKRRMDVMR